MRVDRPIFLSHSRFCFMFSSFLFLTCTTKILYTCRNWLSSPDLKTALNDIHKNFLVIPIDKVTDNTAVVCKRFYTYVTGKELEVSNHSFRDIYIKINNLAAVEIINENSRDLKTKFRIDDIPTEAIDCIMICTGCLRCIKIRKAKFTTVSPKSSIKPLVRTRT